MRPLPALLAVAAAAALPLTGCSSGSAQPAAVASSGAPPAPSSPSSSPLCPAPSGPAQAWPAGFPADFPRLPAQRILATQHTGSGALVARFASPVSLRQAVISALHTLPAHGYVMGRGDAEQFEADMPFRRGQTRGLLRVDQVSPCRLVGLLEVVHVAATPG